MIEGHPFVDARLDQPLSKSWVVGAALECLPYVARPMAGLLIQSPV